MAERAQMIDGKKYLWNGEEYETEAAAREVEKAYGGNGFDVQLQHEGDKVFLYTRRVVTEAVVDEG
jgi:hypothetical protein